jgi:hypothetical protein
VPELSKFKRKISSSGEEGSARDENLNFEIPTGNVSALFLLQEKSVFP